MSDGPAASKLPLLGLPLPISLALVVALLGLIGIRIPGGAKPSGDAPPSMLDVAVDEPDDTSVPAAIEILQEAFGKEVVGKGKASPAPADESQAETIIEAFVSGLLNAPASKVARDKGPPFGNLTGIAAYRELLDEIPEDRLQGMRCVIGILPDPNDSHFQLSFDAGMESLVRAFQAHGYVRDRYRLFWQSDLRSLRGNKEAEARQARRYASPVLFRSQGNSAMLLLVGETPNTGVHREALHDAMDFAWALRSATCTLPLDKDDFLIMGPCYSGSCVGLRDAIEDWAKAARCSSPIKARVISGIATAEENRGVFNKTLSEPSSAEIRFSAAVATDDIVLKGILDHFVHERKIRPQQIAILSETDTSYGAALLNTAKGEGSGLEKIRTLTYPMMLSRMRSEYNRRGIKQEVNEPQAEQLKRRNLDLSQDISPYAVDVLPSFSTSSVAVADRILESLLETIREEEIKVVGIMGTDVTDKLFLAQRIRQLVPNVQLFTLEADFLFTHSGYSQLFRGTVVGSSYPLYPPTQRWSLNTALGNAENYAYRPIQFGSDTSQGIYNAAVQLLNGSEEGEEKNRKPLLDYGPLFGNVPTNHPAGVSLAPAGWLSVVGETKLWPLRQIAVTRDRVGEKREEVLGKNHYVTSPNFLPVGISSGLAVALVACFLFWNPGPSVKRNNQGHTKQEANDSEVKSTYGSRLLGGMRWLRLEAGRSSRDFDVVMHRLIFARSMYASLFFLSITAILGCFGAPTYAWLIEFAQGLGSDGWDLRIKCVVIFLVMLSGVVATAYAALRAATAEYRPINPSDGDDARPNEGRDSWVDREVRAAMLTMVVVGLSVMLTATAMAALDSVANRSSYRPTLTAAIALFIVRCSNFSDLVNPLLPIVFLSAIFAIWAYCSLKRLLLASTYEFVNPLALPSGAVPTSSDGYFAFQLRRITKGYESVKASTVGYVALGMRLPDWVFAVGLLMFLVHMLFRDWVPTCEGRMYDLLFRVLYLGAIVVIVGLMLRTRNLFRSTEEMLRSVNHLPLAERFSTIPIEVRSKASDVLYATHPKIDDYSLMIHQMKKFAARLPGWCDADRDALQALETHSCKAMNASNDQQRRPEEDAHLAQEIASFSSRRITPHLLDLWDLKDSNATEKKDDKESPSYVVIPLLGAKLAKRKDDEVTVQGESKQAEPADSWLRDAETLVAVQIAHQIRVVFLYARTLLGGVIAMYLCLLWATNSYPFQPGQMMNFTCLVLMLWMVIIVFNAILRFNRNPILSRINGTEPNRLTFDSSFWVPMISYVGLPILAVLATLLPTVGRSLFSWTAIFSQMLVSGG